jgi:hypothetical protein
MNFDTPMGDAKRSRVPAVNTINSEPEPDEASTQFATATSAQIALSIGINLTALDLDDLTRQSCAELVTAFFWRELGLKRAPRFDGDTVIPGDDTSAPAPQEIDCDEMARHLKRVAIAQPTSLCNARANIGAMAVLLNLSSVEQKLLAWSFAAAYANCAELFDRLAYELRFSDNERKYAMLAILLSEPVDSVKTAFVSGRLLALRLMTASAWHRAAHLSHVLSATFEGLWLLQTRHPSRNALMAFLQSSEWDCTLIVDPATPSSVYRECFPERISEAYERTVKQQALRASDIASVIQWFTTIEVPAERLEPLAGRLDFETIRESLKASFVERGKANAPTTEFDLLRTLYNAAT